MSDRNVQASTAEVPEIPDLLEKALLYALDEGRKKLENDEELVPFTGLIVKDNVFLETHPADSAEECFNLAQHTVEGARGADVYAFCYDGYVETDEGTKDAIISEGGLPGEDDGYAVGIMYTVDESADGAITLEESPVFIGKAPNFMSKLKDASEYGEDELNEEYLIDDVPAVPGDN